MRKPIQGAFLIRQMSVRDSGGVSRMDRVLHLTIPA